MELHRFGNSALRVTKIGLGLAALGRPGYINLGHGTDLSFGYDVAKMEANAREVMDLAYSLGIRYFDTARSYGKGEEFLGIWLRSKGKDAKILAGSKWGYTYTANWEVQAEKHEVKDHSLEVLNRQWPISHGHLAPWLGIYHIHSATLESGVLEKKEVLNRLWKLKEEGIVVGLSLSGEMQTQTLEKALELRREGEFLFGSVQATWNLLEQSATEILHQANRQGIGVIIKEALANGRLTSRNVDPAFKSKMYQLEAMAKIHMVGVDALCIAYVTHQPWVDIVLSGAASSAHLLSNVEATNVSLSSEELAILTSMAELPAEYWQTRALLAWN